MDGFENTAKIEERERNWRSRSKIVAIMAHALRLTGAVHFRGMDDYVSKPILQRTVLRHRAGAAGWQKRSPKVRMQLAFLTRPHTTQIIRLAFSPSAISSGTKGCSQRRNCK